MSQMTVPDVLWCSDEDISIRAAADYVTLVPRDQVRARGTDGAIASTARWTLTSATVDFAAQGVAGGFCLQLKTTAASSPFNPPELLVVDSVSGSSCTLRRKGEASAVGQPPGPTSGSTATINFSVPTLRSQVIRASYDINRRFGIDPNLVGRKSSDVYDPDELRDVTVLEVLVRQYEAMAWDASANKDHFTAQAQRFKAERDELLSRLALKWAPVTTTQPTGRFSTRLGRG